MKVLLVALNAKYVHSNLAVYDIYAYAKKHSAYGGELLVREYTINQNMDQILSLIYQEKCDVIAFSSYIWNIREIISLSKELNKIQKDIKIWLGGPEVSYHSEELLKKHPYITGIMKGEGEETFARLLEVFQENASDYQKISGITFWDTEGNIVSTPCQALVSMDEIPFIYDELNEFENKIIYYESSRGCPFSCSYCLSSIDKSVRFRSMELVEKELQIFLDAKIPQVKFIDRTFNCKRDRAIKIWEYITNHDNGVTNFHFEISADLLGEEELALFSKMRPGLIQLEIGLQTTNEKTIEEIRRRMDISRLKSNMLAIRSLGNIHEHLDLIAGLPYEDYESFKKSFKDAYGMRPHQLQLGFLKVLKGSYMEEMKEAYGIVYHDEQPYEVMQTKWISFEEIIQLKHVEEMVEIYHNSAQFEHTLSYLMTLYENPYDCFEELSSFYEENGYYLIGFKREARYEAIREFAKKKFIDLTVFDGLLTYDYYLREHAKTRPSWAKEEPIPKEQFHQFFKNRGTKDFSLEDKLQMKEYDSKTVSRMVHIEVIPYEAFTRIENPYGEVHITKEGTVYCIFDYEHRSPLSKDAKVFFLSEL